VERVVTTVSHRVAQIHTYMNQIFMYFRMLHTMGDMNELEVRRHVSRLFSTVDGREFWSRAAASYVDGVQSRLDRKFCRLVQEEYERTMSPLKASTGAP
jgi:hypothetical protein